jgi:hypothetical protein
MNDCTSKLAEVRARIESAKADWESHTSNANAGRLAGAASYLLTRNSGSFGRAAGTIGGLGGYMYGRAQSNKASAMDAKIEADLELALVLVKTACARPTKIPAEIHQCVWMHNFALDRALEGYREHPKVLLTNRSADVVVNPHRTTKMLRFLEFNRAICQVVSTLPSAENVFNSMSAFSAGLDRRKLRNEVVVSWVILGLSIVLAFVNGIGIFLAIGWYVAHRFHGITPLTRSIRLELGNFERGVNECGPIRVG